MAAGTKYNLTPEYKPEEFYRVETGVRKSGPWKLDITNLVVGSVLPVFTPVQAD
ncbi:head fiber protein, partial [Bacteroides fragilis]